MPEARAVNHEQEEEQSPKALEDFPNILSCERSQQYGLSLLALALQVLIS
jgi:hypothetical protein